MTKDEMYEFLTANIEKTCMDDSALLEGSACDGMLELCNETNKEYLDENIITIDISEVSKCTLNKDKFQEGMNEVSALCGKIVALTNVGITPNMALSYIADVDGQSHMSEYNLKVSKMNAESNVESAKFGASFLSKMSM